MQKYIYVTILGSFSRGNALVNKSDNSLVFFPLNCSVIFITFSFTFAYSFFKKNIRMVVNDSILNFSKFHIFTLHSTKEAFCFTSLDNQAC